MIFWLIGLATRKSWQRMLLPKGAAAHGHPQGHWMLWSETKDQYLWEFVTSDFNFDGGYNGFFKALCKGRQRKDVSTHTTQNIFISFIKLHLTYLFFSNFVPLLLPITNTITFYHPSPITHHQSSAILWSEVPSLSTFCHQCQEDWHLQV